ncbi:sucrose-6-phosphate hydrolase [Spiroplasma clarkii]|uniref:beta-fructofuranosidase n=1 Tax=Spiroplasma clarkii TaxID=2139 RepID=A0A1Y0L0W8_9MOLU|nr:GH32 C-terminal domain-containing protein [Spiroplasma clarkii]ARU91631.1 sucrose-6-phosphate hydrolase [Spiroplasma clarkii]ATX71027.1 beta-fructofuranosidase [Spiroplasma clarkii]
MKLKPELIWIKSNQHKQKDIDAYNNLVASDKYYRPVFHLAPPNGLMNDPNGLLFKDGVHHIHYQWSPLQPYHGFKHWLYVTTSDFVNYHDHGESIIPDHPKEAGGAFSGSAYDFGDKVKIYYTGNNEDGNGNVIEEVQIAADFVNGKIINKEVVVENDFERFTAHVRDPKIFEYQGKKYLVFGAQCRDTKKGGLVFYEMQTPEKFTYFKTLTSSLNVDYGHMWECPNLDPLEDKILFMISSEGWFKNDDKYELNSTRNVVYTAIKEFDFENNKLKEEFEMVTMDYGYDFYAPQTYWVDKKLVLLAWFGNVDVQYPTDQFAWHSIMTIPRELSWNKNVLVQKPLAEYCKNILTNKTKKTVTEIKDKQVMHLKFELVGDLEIKISNDKNEFMNIKFDSKEISMDRTHQSEPVDSTCEAPRYAIRKIDKQFVEMFIDRSSIEMFADDYQTIFTSRFFIRDWNKIEFSKEINVEISDVNR